MSAARIDTVSGQFGERPAVYRGTLTLSGRSRPIRHLVVASTRLRAEGNQARIIVKRNSPDLILRAAANFHGLPLLSEWTSGSSPVSKSPAGCGHCPA